MTLESAAPEASPSDRPRPVRRAPADLPFSFPTAALAASLADERREPDWLRAERLAAAAAYDQLPAESNVLYTPYIDLRAADLQSVEPYRQTAAVPSAPGRIPDDTAGLIETSVRNAHAGVAISEEVSGMFGQITAAATEVSGMIGEIAAATTQQSTGIDQVTRAVHEMDKVTQGNAASAEESASSSCELATQAKTMQGAVTTLVHLVGGA